MTEFKRTLQAVDEIEQLVSVVAGGGNNQLPHLDQLLRDTGPVVEKLRRKATESDPVKQTYGPQMCQKVLAMCERWDNLRGLAKDVLDTAPASALASAPVAAPKAPPPPTQPSPAASGIRVPSIAALDAAARPPAPSVPQATGGPSPAERREMAARAAEARFGGVASTKATTETIAPAAIVSTKPAVAPPSTAGAIANKTASFAPVATMDALLHLVHCVFLAHGFARTEGGEGAPVPSGLRRVHYTRADKPAISATYVPVQGHLLVYASLGGATITPNRLALHLGMGTAVVQAKTDYLLVYPLVYSQCLPALPNLPPEVAFCTLACLAIPGLGAMGCVSKAFKQSVFEDDVLWWRVLLALPPSDSLRATVDATMASRTTGDGSGLPAGECRRLVRREVERARQEEDARRRAREEMERQMRNPLRIGPTRQPPRFPGQPFGPFGGVIGGDSDLMPGGLRGPFGGSHRWPFGGGGGFGGGFGGGNI
mmetsp:Transcript_119402/g.337824  ORF Transcript_119402/g.337824 Transcript_119402/m.337824 type:complete len:484 (-) Transcript_119402:201-1652(-)